MPLKCVYFGILLSILLAVNELIIAVTLQHFLIQLKVLDGTSPLSGYLDRFNLHLTIVQVAFFFIFVNFFRGVIQYFVAVSNSIAIELVNFRTRMIAINGMLISSGKFVSSTEINFVISEIAYKAAKFMSSFGMMINIAIESIILITFMFFISWKISLAALFGLTFAGIFVSIVSIKIKKISSIIPGEQHMLLKGIQRVSANWLLVKILRTQNQEYNRLSEHAVAYSRGYINAVSLSSLTGIIPAFMGTLLLTILLLANFYFLKTEHNSFLTFFYLFFRFTQSVSAFSKLYGNVINVMPQYRSALNIFKKATSLQLDDIALLENKIVARRTSTFKLKPACALALSFPCEKFAPKIEVKSLKFAYPEQNIIIGNLNFQLASGLQLGIVGRSGSGKSTLLKLILGIENPTDGTIQIDGLPPKQYFERDAGVVGYVGPEPFLFKGTIRENLLYGNYRNDLKEEEFFEALNAAFLLKEIRSKDKILEFELNENADGLSAGQKQRLALARALLIKPKLLILDEASSNLDPDAEETITASIQQMKGICTTIIVSHRSGILKFADKVITLEKT